MQKKKTKFISILNRRKKLIVCKFSGDREDIEHLGAKKWDTCTILLKLNVIRFKIKLKKFNKY